MSQWLNIDHNVCRMSAVLKLFYLTGASLNICKWFCNALPVF